VPPRSPDTGSALAGHFGRNEWTLSSETAGHLHPKRVVTYAEIHTIDLTFRLRGAPLSCSHDGCANVPRPQRRWVVRGCISKRITSSLAFVRCPGTRRPVGLLSEGRSRRGRLRFMLRTAGLHLPCWKARPRASTPRSPQTPAGYYKGDLVPPSTGLPPASHRELSGRTGRRLPRPGLVRATQGAHARRTTEPLPRPGLFTSAYGAHARRTFETLTRHGHVPV